MTTDAEDDKIDVEDGAPYGNDNASKNHKKKHEAENKQRNIPKIKESQVILRKEFDSRIKDGRVLLTIIKEKQDRHKINSDIHKKLLSEKISKRIVSF